MDNERSAPENTDAFDIQTGMAVYDSNHQKIGSIIEIAGFGGVKVPKPGEEASGKLVVQAKTASGSFYVDRTAVEGVRAATPLCVPFHGIGEVTPGHGVTLNDTIINELHHQMDPRPVEELTPAGKPRRWWPKWL